MHTIVAGWVPDGLLVPEVVGGEEDLSEIAVGLKAHVPVVVPAVGQDELRALLPEPVADGPAHHPGGAEHRGHRPGEG